MSRWRRHAPRWGRTPTLWRSIRSSAALERRRSDGHRRCIRSPATWHDCSRSTAPPARRPDAGLRSLPRRSGEGGLRIVELAPILVGCAWQELEEGVEAPVERPAQLRYGAVDRVQRHAGSSTVAELKPCVFRPLEGAFRHEAKSVDQRVTGHRPTIAAVARPSPTALPGTLADWR